MSLATAWIVLGVICGPIVAYKAHRMRQPWFPWLVAGMALSLIALAVVQYYEPTRAERKAAADRIRPPDSN